MLGCSNLISELLAGVQLPLWNACTWHARHGVLNADIALCSGRDNAG